MDIWLTADTHFGHPGILKYTERQFANTDEMDECLIQRWNERIKPHDHVYHLGDVSFRNRDRTISILSRLHGRIHLVKGNHDRAMTKQAFAPYFVWVKDYYELRLEGQLIVMCHFPFLVWDKMHYGSIHCHGHSHGSLAANRTGKHKRKDVGVDTNSLYPYHLYDEILPEMQQRKFEAVDHHTEER